MSDFLDDLHKDMQKDAAETRRKADAQERRLQKAEEERIQDGIELEEARQKVIKERRITHAWGWAAAELLNLQTDPPADRKYWLYTQGKKFWSREPIMGIAAEGWPLMGWTNNGEYPNLRHTLFLSPRDSGHEGNYLRYITQQVSNNNPVGEVLPYQVHTFPMEPLSEEDMPWPNDPKNQWEKDAFITVDDVNIWSRMYRNDPLHIELLEAVRSIRKQRHKFHYDTYADNNAEKTIRKAIAHTAAQHLIIAPEQATKRIQQRIKLGIEQTPNES